MGYALLIALGSVVIGAAWGLVSGGRLSPGILKVVRLVAVIAVLFAVGFALMPEAIEALGWRAVVVALLGIATPIAFERIADFLLALIKRKRAPLAASQAHCEEHHIAWGEEVAFGGLLIHSLGDGIALWAVTSGSPHAGEHGALAIALHTIPVVALVVIRFSAVSGPRAALLRAAGLAVATAVGIVAAGLVPSAMAHTLMPWVDAFAAGLLVHIVFHRHENHGHLEISRKHLHAAPHAAGPTKEAAAPKTEVC